MRAAVPVAAFALVAAWASGMEAQDLRGLTATRFSSTTTATTLCGAAVPQPSSLPPSEMPSVVYLIVPCLGDGRGNTNLASYLADIQLRPSRPSLGEWVAYDTAAERIIVEDFRRLWGNHSLVDLSIDVRDHQFSNGVTGKVVVYNIKERLP